MTILIEQQQQQQHQPEFGAEVGGGKEIVVDEKELVLDGGFLVPHTNSFGQTFRDYDAEGERQPSVEKFYKINHLNHTYDFVQRMRKEYSKLNRVEMSIWECCELLNEVLRIHIPHGKMGPSLWVYKGLGYSFHCQLVLDWIPRLLYHGIRAGYPRPRVKPKWPHELHVTQNVVHVYDLKIRHTCGGVLRIHIPHGKMGPSLWVYKGLGYSFHCQLVLDWIPRLLYHEVVDESDPDLDEPQIEHLLQTAEAIRKDYPNEDWLHLTGLIHDLGKVLLLPCFGELPQWAVVGDTFPVGCAFDESNVHHKYFKENPDYNNPAYNTKHGVYSEKCGLNNVLMSWGHDDYMYLVAKENKTTLPSAGLFIIRYHSFYGLHKAGAYKHLMNEEDLDNLKWLHVFNKYDLYSKSKVRVDVEKVKPYYLSLIKKYFPTAKLRW